MTQSSFVQETGWYSPLLAILQAEKNLLQGIQTQLQLKKHCIVNNNLQELNQLDQGLNAIAHQLKQLEHNRLALFRVHHLPETSVLEHLLRQLPPEAASQLRQEKIALNQQNHHIHTLSQEVDALLNESIRFIEQTVQEFGEALGGTPQTYQPTPKRKQNASTSLPQGLPSSTVSCSA